MVSKIFTSRALSRVVAIALCFRGGGRESQPEENDDDDEKIVSSRTTPPKKALDIASRTPHRSPQSPKKKTTTTTTIRKISRHKPRHRLRLPTGFSSPVEGSIGFDIHVTLSTQYRSDCFKTFEWVLRSADSPQTHK